MMTLKAVMFILFVFALGACDQPVSEETGQPAVEATSLLGEPLYRPAIADPTWTSRRVKLAEARLDLERNADDELAWIWVGRRLAYLGRYQDAIEHYTRAIEKFPESHKLLRHRGHRYITTRQFDKAIDDLERGLGLMSGHDDAVEPDGLPNAQNLPRSTTMTNLLYHLALAHYLKASTMPGQGELDSLKQGLIARIGFRNCIDVSTNDDMRIAALYWMYLSGRQQGIHEGSQALLDQVTPEMDIIENDGYHRLLLLFKGELTESDLLEGLEEGIATPTVLYGVSQYRALRGDEKGARELLDRIIEDGNWPAFGYIAAEADLARDPRDDPAPTIAP